MGHIFISYSHKDKDYVEELEKKLVDQGFDVWIDHRIDYGSRWTKEIEKAIDTCDAYVVIMSKNAAESQWVERERIHAEKRRKPFFPLLLSGESWFSLGNIQFVDVKGGELPPEEYYEDIARFVSRKADAASIGAGVEDTAPQKQKAPFWIGGAVMFGLLVVGGFVLSKIFSEPDLPVKATAEITVMPATITLTPADLGHVDVTDVPATNTPEPTETSEPTQDPNTPPADAEAGHAWTRPTDGMVMSYIPAGEFQMGSEDGADDEKPVHMVYLDAYWIDQTEVTNAMYAECVFDGRCEKLYNAAYIDDPAYSKHPVVFVNWEQARNYCEVVGGRLPTEAEWEKAARGGLEGKKYPWGDEAPVCNLGAVNGAKFDDNKACNDSQPGPVAKFSGNGYGIYDMAGNVWEWVADLYAKDFYASSPQKNPLGPASSGPYGVLRGGSWGYRDYNLRSADRLINYLSGRSSDIGFRCALSEIP